MMSLTFGGKNKRFVRENTKRKYMLPTPKEYFELFDNILANKPQGHPRNVNMYKTCGYFADMPVIPLTTHKRSTNVFSKTLKVTVALSEKGHSLKWRISNPKPKDIFKALRYIQNGVYHSYMILSIPGNSYIQTNTHALEYRKDSADNHFHCPPEFLNTLVILKAFLSYNNECTWWRKSIQWKKGYGP